MSWGLVARREVLDAGRSRWLGTVVGLFAFVAGLAVVLPAAAVDGPLAPGEALAFLVAPLRTLVAVIALLAGYGAVVGARAGGQLKLALGLPIRRSAVVLGAFAGRSAVVLGVVSVGFVAVGVALQVVHGIVPLGRLLGLAGLAGLYAVAVTALAVGISAATGSPRRAAAAAVGVFVLFQFFWGLVPGATHYLVAGTLPGRTVPAWFVLLERLQPLAAFQSAADLVVLDVDRVVRLAAGGAGSPDAPARPSTADRVGGSVPFYLAPWFGVVTLAGWTVLPLAAGAYRFRRADL